jgi:hypothetical protein
MCCLTRKPNDVIGGNADHGIDMEHNSVDTIYNRSEYIPGLVIVFFPPRCKMANCSVAISQLFEGLASISASCKIYVVPVHVPIFCIYTTNTYYQTTMILSLRVG